MNGLSGDDRAVIRSQKHADGCDFDWLSWAAQWSAVESLYIVLAKEGGTESTSGSNERDRRKKHT